MRTEKAYPFSSVRYSIGMHIAEAPISVHVAISQDMARVARWMAGKAVGLVLSGGGSRGLAHLGVLHALDDAGVPIDVIGGTSQVPLCLALYCPPGHSIHCSQQLKEHVMPAPCCACHHSQQACSQDFTRSLLDLFRTAAEPLVPNHWAEPSLAWYCTESACAHIAKCCLVHLFDIVSRREACAAGRLHGGAVRPGPGLGAHA